MKTSNRAKTWMRTMAVLLSLCLGIGLTAGVTVKARDDVAYGDMAVSVGYTEEDFQKLGDAIDEQARNLAKTSDVVANVQKMYDMLSEIAYAGEKAELEAARNFKEENWKSRDEIDNLYNSVQWRVNDAIGRLYAMPDGEKAIASLSNGAKEFFKNNTDETSKASRLRDASEWAREKYYEEGDKVTIEVSGKEINRENVDASSEEEQNQYWTKVGEVHASLVPAIIKARNRYAVEKGYKNYYELRAKESGRDYTTKQIKAFRDAVKETVSPYLFLLGAVQLDGKKLEGIYTAKFEDTDVISKVQASIEGIAPKLSEAFEYMVKNNLYEIRQAEGREIRNEVRLVGDGKPFLYSNEMNSLGDICGKLSEAFGIYAGTYFNNSSFASRIDDDVMVAKNFVMRYALLNGIASTFGDNGSEQVKLELRNIFPNLVYGCMYDEFEQYLYTEKNLTAEKIGEKYLELWLAYGMDKVWGERSNTDWIHAEEFLYSPCTNIYMAIGASAAAEMYMDIIEDPAKAGTNLTKLIKSANSGSLPKMFKASNLPDVVKSKSVEDLVKNILQKIGVPAKMLGE